MIAYQSPEGVITVDFNLLARPVRDIVVCFKVNIVTGN